MCFFGVIDSLRIVWLLRGYCMVIVWCVQAKMLYRRMGFGYERDITIFNEVYYLYVAKP